MVALTFDGIIIENKEYHMMKVLELGIYIHTHLRVKTSEGGVIQEFLYNQITRLVITKQY